MNLSLCMMVKDEARVLARCLASVAELAPEIIIVDTGSTDATPEIAAAHGAKVVDFDFRVVNFAAARNRALELATGKWILVLDADETLDPASAPVIQELTTRDENAGYYFNRLNRQQGLEPTTDYVVRLFPKRSGYRYRNRVHETVDASILAGGGQLLRSRIRIFHDFACDLEARRQRNLRYIGILKEEIAADPADDSRMVFLAAEYHQLGMFDEAAAIAEQIAIMRPLNPEAHLHAGVYHLCYKGNRERARGYFMEALRLRPEYPEALSFLQTLEEQEQESAANEHK